MRKNTLENRFFLWDVIPWLAVEDLIGLDRDIDANNLREHFEEKAKKEHGIFDVIKKTSISELSIAGLVNPNAIAFLTCRAPKADLA